MTEIIQRLEQLPEDITQTFKPDFIFIIYPDKVQHFPARQWHQTDLQTKVAELFSAPVEKTTWRDLLVIYQLNRPDFLVVPGFSKL